MHLLQKCVLGIRRSGITRLVLFPFFFLLAVQALYGQKIGFSGGVNKNNYFDFVKEDGGRFETDYHPGYGYSFAMSIADIKIDSFMPLRLALLVDHYKGSFYTSTGGMSYGEHTRADVAKTTIGIGIYPINFSVLKRIEFSVGGEFHFRIQDKTVGKKSWWGGSGIYTTAGHLENDSMNINNNLVFGVSGQVGYSFRLKNNLWIVPGYRYFLGVSNEFKNTESEIKSMRHNIQVGLVKNL